VLGRAHAARIPAAIVAGDADAAVVAALPRGVPCVTLVSLAGATGDPLRDAASLAADAAARVAGG